MTIAALRSVFALPDPAASCERHPARTATDASARALTASGISSGKGYPPSFVWLNIA